MERNYLEELNEILNSDKTIEEKKKLILQYHDNDIADACEQLSSERRKKLFEVLGTEKAAEVMTYIENVENVVGDMSTEVAADYLEQMDSDDAIDILQELDDDSRGEIVKLMDPDAISDIKTITSFADDEIGSRMTNNYISIKKTDTVKQAMKRVIEEAADNDNVSNVYILDDYEHLVGVIELRDLIIARSNDDLMSLVKGNYPSFLGMAKMADCINQLKEYGLSSYPIVDVSNKLLGVITADDVVQAVDEEFGDDYAKFAGLTEAAQKDDTIIKAILKRLPWLVILLVLDLFESFGMTNFENVVASLPVIVFFQAMVLGMSGNTGTQSLAVTIRMLSIEENNKLKLFKTVLREIRIGFVNGLILGVISFVVVFVYMIITKQNPQGGEVFYTPDAARGALIVSCALVCAMTVSAFVGALMPILFVKVNIDPAVASGPFITTINDIVSLVIYYGLAYLIFLA